MTVYYSVKQRGFFPDNVYYPVLPDDLQPISDEAYALFFSGAEGHVQVFDEQGPRLQAITE